MSSSASGSSTASASVTLSHSLSWSFSFSASFTSSFSTSATGSATSSTSNSLSSSATTTSSHTLSATASESASGSSSWSLTTSASYSGSLSSTQSVSRSSSSTMTATPSASSSFSSSATFTGSLSYSSSFSAVLSTSVAPPTTTEVSPTGTAPTHCPLNCEHGDCSEAQPFRCICYNNGIRGYWSGAMTHGGTCDMCSVGAFGSQCKQVCPGGTCNPCNGHGRCDDGLTGSGNCVCHNDTFHGYWSGRSCNTCAERYYGIRCTVLCDCNGHGTCHAQPDNPEDVRCQCDSNWVGDNCSECATNAYGPNCEDCPSGRTHPCSGNGVCNDTLQGTGTCVCFFPWAGDNCTGLDPNSLQSVFCPGPYGTPCSGFGNCTVNMSSPLERNGTCQCNEKHTGGDCSIACPVDARGKVCSNHGQCLGDGSCECYASFDTGFWSGPTCAQCKDTHSGTNCTIPCPLSILNQSCSGNTCVNGKCICVAGTCGTACEQSGAVCQPCVRVGNKSWYGPLCDKECLCAYGECNAGKLGDGSCSCYSGYTGTLCDVECAGGASAPCSLNGVCQFDGNCTCNSGFFSSSCSERCPFATIDGANVTCSNHGSCLDGARGSGLCVCRQAATYGFWTGPSCGDCVAHYWGLQCTQVCGHGTTVGQQCLCDAGYGGPTCDELCPNASGALCSDHGRCSNGTSGTGQCVCQDEWLGPSCNCSDALCRSTLPNTKCDATTGMCVCDEFHSGVGCKACDSAYWGSTCREICTCRTFIEGVAGRSSRIV